MQMTISYTHTLDRERWRTVEEWLVSMPIQPVGDRLLGLDGTNSAREWSGRSCGRRVP